ncbi:hypothetical protein PoB_000291200 [Plakobranchus ocellatus]|uniref:Uncharacterized protein n=1 Tax=Plakobranchus ocellatus TaxID=259542 RepID=A0AAV3Y1S5_9GAST|nr:hypothetical protein PoB_000291200 [Plakobranchus ocellatus]
MIKRDDRKLDAKLSASRSDASSDHDITPSNPTQASVASAATEDIETYLFGSQLQHEPLQPIAGEPKQTAPKSKSSLNWTGKESFLKHRNHLNPTWIFTNPTRLGVDSDSSEKVSHCTCTYGDGVLATQGDLSRRLRGHGVLKGMGKGRLQVRSPMVDFRGGNEAGAGMPAGRRYL